MKILLAGSGAREAIESYYLETREGFFFAVKGLEHPPHLWIAVVRYVPDRETGTREKNGDFYRRLYNFREQEQWIKEFCPQYRTYDPVFQTTLQSVPRLLVRNVYNPRLKLQELAQAITRDRVEEDVVAFARFLENEARVPESALGVTGSVLIGMHTECSDMDIAAFGENDCRKVYRALQRLLADPSCTELRRLDAVEVEELFARRVVDTKMEFGDFANLEGQKANQGIFRGRPYFIRFIQEPSEAGVVYGQFHYTPIGPETIQATVVESRDSIFTPCRYGLAGSKTSGKERIQDLDQIVSFRGRFCDQARTGDRILATGTLEQVRDGLGIVRHRLLLGNSREDTMIVTR